MSKTIVVTVSQVGSPTIEANGFNGVGCKEATRNIEKALSDGKTENEVENKPEINNVDTQQSNTAYLGNRY